MMRVLTVLGLSAAAVRGQAGAASVSAACLKFDGLSFYDVRSLKSEQDFTASEDPAVKYYFNLCAYPVGSYCGGAQKAFAFRVNETDGSCAALTDDQITPMLLEGDFVKFAYPPTANATCGDRHHQLTVKVRCDGALNETVAESVDEADPCAPVITLASAKACPAFSASGFSQFFLERPGILGFVAVLFGLIVAVYGRKFFPLTIFSTGTLVGFGISLLLFTILSMLDSHGKLSFLSSLLQYLLSLATGAFLGFILQRMLKIAAAIFGAVGGYFISAALFSWVVNDYLHTTLLVLFAAGAAALSTRFYDNIVIFSTSVFGSFCFVHGFSLIIDKDASVYAQILAGDFDSLMYVYLSVLALMASLGTFYQFKQMSQEAKFDAN